MPIIEDKMKNIPVCFVLVLLLSFCSCTQNRGVEVQRIEKENRKKERFKDLKMEKATFGSGCFWCTEAIFQNVKGVESVVSGYSGGSVKNPSYKEVCTGTTGHAEVVQITFAPEIISYDELLEIFWQTHDPTTFNRQGNDVGPQYRSVVFYHTEEQRQIAEKYKKQLDQSGTWENPIVTEISPYTEFYPAEEEHQNYYNLNKMQPYCALVIRPKLEKFKKVFSEKIEE